MSTKIAGRLSLLFATVAGAAFTSHEVPADELPSKPISLTASLVRTGLHLLPFSVPEINVRLGFAIKLPGISVSADVQASTIDARLKELQERIAAEQTPILRQQLEVMLDQLKALKVHNELLAEQNRTQAKLLDVQVKIFDYLKQDKEGLLARTSTRCPQTSWSSLCRTFRVATPTKAGRLPTRSATT